MRIELHNRLGQPQVIEATRVVVYDKFDNPVALSLEISDGVILSEHAGNSRNFNEILRNLGVSRTVIVQRQSQVPLDEIRFS